MCGYVFYLSSKKQDLKIIKKSLESIKYRGPDDTKSIEGFTNNEYQYFLGFNRLSIYDLSKNSMQPFQAEGDNILLLFNGSIYNYKEIRKKIIDKGYKFITTGDTEVVYAAFKIFGKNCFKLFNGIWSIVLFDKFTGKIIFCRDRLGVKPLYYQVDNNNQKTIFAASEPVCFLKKSINNFEINSKSIQKFALTGIHDDNNETFYKNISQIDPGTFVEIFDGEIKTIQKYDDWTLNQNDKDLEKRLLESVNLRTESDVPSFSFLSGGLDSSLIAKMISEKRKKNRGSFKGFITFGYEEKNDFDEISYAEEIIKDFKSDISHYKIKEKSYLGLDQIRELTEVQQEPFNNPGYYSHYKTYQWINKQNIRVVLTGEGADEIFGGYTKVYNPTYFLDALKKINLKLMMEIIYSRQCSLKKLFQKLLFILPNSVACAMLKIVRSNSIILKDDFLNDERDSLETWIKQQKLNLNERLNFDILKSVLPGILRCADRLSMKNSIETRHPFLDFNVIKFAMNMNIHDRAGIIGKNSLRKISKKFNIKNWNIPKKHGFGGSLEFNYMSKDFKEFLIDNRDTWKDYFDDEKFKKVFEKNIYDSSNWRAFSIMMWLIWLNELKKNFYEINK